MDEIAATTPTFAGVCFDRLDAEGSMQWPVNDKAPNGTPTMHVGEFVRGKGRLIETVYVPTTERSTRRFPLILTTGRILSQYNVGAQTRRTDNNAWHPEDVLEIHPSDAQMRGISTGDLVALSSRVGTTTLRAEVSHRMPPGVVYTTFHHPVTGANVVTTENSDWATNCPGVQGHGGPGRGRELPRRDRRRVGGSRRRARGGRPGMSTIAPEARMGNDIARQFAHLPEDEALARIVAHVTRSGRPRCASGSRSSRRRAPPTSTRYWPAPRPGCEQVMPSSKASRILRSSDGSAGQQQRSASFPRRVWTTTTTMRVASAARITKNTGQL